MFFSRCNYLANNINDKIIARIGDDLLYLSDIYSDLENISGSDSIIKSKKLIENWARKKLLFEKSKLNLSLNTQEELSVLVNNYKYDLFTATYKELILKNQIDTIIDFNEIKDYYNQNANNFKLNQDIFKIRYLLIPIQNTNLNVLKKKLVRFEKEDLFFLDSLSFQFTEFNFNDSTWINKNEFLNSMKIEQEFNFKNINLVKRFFQFKNSTDIFMLYIEDHVKVSETPPFDYVYRTIKNIVYNRRKIEFIKDFEKDILQDAIQENRFEVYN
tara:strand:+ start:16497 stop:17312 length:816 start_codon:yes stop_codon:yes gene_type:complete